MITLSFVAGGNIRKVIINKKKISMLTKETGWVPVVMDLDKMQKLSKELKDKLRDEDKKVISQLKKIASEEEIAKDIIKDFRQTGWRLFKRE